MQRPSVVLIYDSPDWAFHRIAQTIQRLTPQWDCTSLAYPSLREGDLEPYDLCILLGYHGSTWAAKGRPRRLVTCVYDHVGWRTVGGRKRLDVAAELSDQMLASSLLLRQDLADNGYRVDGLCEDGVDTERFRPSPLWPPPLPADKLPIVGWAGNRTTRCKRYELAEEAVGDMGHWRPAERNEHPVPYDAMPAYYHGLHVLVCTSTAEGTPNPILEAAASGVPWVSTAVGLCPEIGGGVCVPTDPPDEVVRSIKRELRRLRNPEVLREAGRRCRLAIEEGGWAWRQRVRQFWSLLPSETSSSSTGDSRAAR